MKPLKTLLFFLICAAIYAGCGENTDAVGSADIHFSDFAVPSDCAANYSNMWHDSVCVINSEEEWTAMFTCGCNPKTDFSSNTILVAFGGTTNGIRNISKKLLFTNDTCFLSVDITLDITAVAQTWRLVLISDKINTQKVFLKLNKHFGNENV
jgi:hypothetical protein